MCDNNFIDTLLPAACCTAISRLHTLPSLFLFLLLFSLTKTKMSATKSMPWKGNEIKQNSWKQSRSKSHTHAEWDGERERARGGYREEGGRGTHGYPLLSLVPCALRQLYVSFGCSFIWPNIMRVYVYGLPLQENGKTHKKTIEKEWERGGGKDGV